MAFDERNKRLLRKALIHYDGEMRRGVSPLDRHNMAEELIAYIEVMEEHVPVVAPRDGEPGSDAFWEYLKFHNVPRQVETHQGRTLVYVPLLERDEMFDAGIKFYEFRRRASPHQQNWPVLTGRS